MVKKQTIAESEYHSHASNSPGPSTSFTRSVTTPLVKHHYFFCQLANKENLIGLRTDNVEKELRKVVEISQNPVLLTRLNNGIYLPDTHKIDILYKITC